MRDYASYYTNAFKRRQIRNVMHAFRADSLGNGWKSPSKPGFALHPPARLPLHPPASLQEQLSPLRFELCNSGVSSGKKMLPADTNKDVQLQGEDGGPARAGPAPLYYRCIIGTHSRQFRVTCRLTENPHGAKPSSADVKLRSAGLHFLHLLLIPLQ